MEEKYIDKLGKISARFINKHSQRTRSRMLTTMEAMNYMVISPLKASKKE